MEKLGASSSRVFLADVKDLGLRNKSFCISKRVFSSHRIILVTAEGLSGKSCSVFTSDYSPVDVNFFVCNGKCFIDKRSFIGRNGLIPSTKA